MYSPDHRTTAPRLLGALATIAAAGYALPALAGAWPRLRGLMGIEDTTASGRGYALTFDDGPHPQGTAAVLEILAQRGIGATFFLVGEQVARDPALAREIAAAGHQIGLHCYRHRNLLRLSPMQVQEDIARAQATIEDATGRAIRLYRPPYGALNAWALGLARARGWRTLLWTHWGRDWEARATPESILALVTADVGEGAVLLLHDADDYGAPECWRRTVAALPEIIDTLAQLGLQPVSA
jgi:peptidoglycan/xylan/chitin deacetylase (PgdA/CDA1 family)